MAKRSPPYILSISYLLLAYTERRLLCPFSACGRGLARVHEDKPLPQSGHSSARLVLERSENRKPRNKENNR